MSDPKRVYYYQLEYVLDSSVPEYKDARSLKRKILVYSSPVSAKNIAEAKKALLVERGITSYVRSIHILNTIRISKRDTLLIEPMREVSRKLTAAEWDIIRENRERVESTCAYYPDLTSTNQVVNPPILETTATSTEGSTQYNHSYTALTEGAELDEGQGYLDTESLAEPTEIVVESKPQSYLYEEEEDHLTSLIKDNMDIITILIDFACLTALAIFAYVFFRRG